MSHKLLSKETRDTLHLAAQEADTAMLRLVGICDPELLPPGEFKTMKRVNNELEDAAKRLYAMAVVETKAAHDE
jgi:hypothetical protein